MGQEQLNRPVYARAATVAAYASAAGFCDEGERLLFEQYKHELRGKRILDLGVGGGRTIPLLMPLASSYVALDYVPEMVGAAQRRFPSVDIQVGDGRDLSRFADASFDAVVFSFNGLDCLSHYDRPRALQEVLRVLQPGGLFWFSTLNIEGRGRHMRPWHPEWPKFEGNPLRFAFQTLRMGLHMPRRILNRARIWPQFVQGNGWCHDTISAHDYALVVHYTTLKRQLQELTEVGFEPNPTVRESGTGQEVAADDDHLGTFWFQILAHKPH